MKKNYYLGIFIFCFIFVDAQVGINTTTPEATLDVNGNVIIREVEDASSSPSYNFLVVDGTTHKVGKVSGNLSGGSGSTSNSTIAKAVEEDGISLISAEFYPGWNRIDFGSGHVPINSGNHFDPSTDTYTVPSAGVYAVNFEFRYGNGVQLQLLNFSGSPRIGILKQKTSGYDVVDERVFSGANVSLFGIGALSIIVSSVSMNSLYTFAANDVISFEVAPGGISLGLLDDSYTSVTIYKISD